MDPRQCIAYHTYFNDGEIPLEIREKMGTWVYGCDICQEVCPRNKKWLEKNKRLDEKLMKRAKDFDLITLLTMSPEHFQQKVWPLLYYIRQDKSYLWQRNAAVALGNEKNPEAIPHLLAVLENPEPLVRMHVAWALGKIGGRQAKSALENREKFEPNEKVRQEIKFALSRI
jgi:epoxyqueuosine reductase